MVRSTVRAGLDRLDRPSVNRDLTSPASVDAPHRAVPLERQLKGVEIGCRFGFEETIQAATMHQIGTDQSGEGEWAFDGGLCRLGEAEEQKGDQCDGDLDAPAFSEVPRKRRILRVCLTQRKTFRSLGLVLEHCGPGPA